MPIITIKNEVIIGRVYRLSNSIDNYIYIGSTTLPLNKRLGNHMYDYNRDYNMNLYRHMRKIGLSKWAIELLEWKAVKNTDELRVIEQIWIE